MSYPLVAYATRCLEEPLEKGRWVDTLTSLLIFASKVCYRTHPPRKTADPEQMLGTKSSLWPGDLVVILM